MCCHPSCFPNPAEDAGNFVSGCVVVVPTSCIHTTGFIEETVGVDKLVELTTGILLENYLIL